MRSQSLRIFLTDFNTNYIIIYLMPSWADDSFLPYVAAVVPLLMEAGVSMPSRADDSFLHPISINLYESSLECQCPLGLMTHFYRITLHLDTLLYTVSMPSRADDSFLRRTLLCVTVRIPVVSVNALSG